MLKKLYFLSFFFTLIALISFSGHAVADKLPTISAKSAVVIDVETGQVLYDKNMNIKSFPASLTKILTTIIALEEGNIKDIVEVSRRAAYQEGSSIYLREGEKIRLEDLLYGVMLASGNDASVAVAEHIVGSVSKFAELMNFKAREMGTLNSNFVNPNGLPDSDHYSTAYDLGMIMRYAMKNKVFREIAKTKNKTISWSGNDWGRGLRNHNKLLWSYDDISGGKTGYTRAAGRCLIASAIRDGREVVAVVLNAPDDWLDIRSLLDYGLDNFTKVKVVDKGEIIHKIFWENSEEGELNLLAEEAIYLLVPRRGKVKLKKKIYLKDSLELPVKKGDSIGYFLILDDYKIVSKIEILANNDLNYNSLFLRFWHWLSTKFKD